MMRGVFEEVGEVVGAPCWRHELHELAQPLTRLQWRLEIGQTGDAATLRETVEGSLADAKEITEWVRRMRTRLGSARLGSAQLGSAELGSAQLAGAQTGRAQAAGE